jgi:membrane protease YdiL (CAAX protease family)
LAIGVPFALALSRVPQVHATYPLLPAARTSGWWFLASTVAFAGYGLAWELFFRGFLLWGLAPRLGLLTIVAQAVPCALLHLGKPTAELAASLPAALVFGALAYRARSVLPGWILHTVLSMTVNVACIVW